MSEWDVAVIKDLNFNGAHLFLRTPDGLAQCVMGIEFDPAKNLESKQAFLRGPSAISFMQSMLDAAYEYGLRPSGVQDDTQLRAHLSDMRKMNEALLSAAIKREVKL